MPPVCPRLKEAGRGEPPPVRPGAVEMAAAQSPAQGWQPDRERFRLLVPVRAPILGSILALPAPDSALHSWRLRRAQYSRERDSPGRDSPGAQNRRHLAEHTSIAAIDP